MYQGETITTTISNFPIPISDIKELFIVFRSGSRVLLEKNLQDCSISGETVSFKLSQEESLMLSEGPIYRSAIIISNDGSRFESCPSIMNCRKTTKDEVIS